MEILNLADGFDGWRCLQGYLWTVNILSYLFYSCFAICLPQRFLDFVDVFQRASNFGTGIGVWCSYNESHSTFSMDLVLPAVRKHNKKKDQLVIFQYIWNKKWATICCSCYISKIYISINNFVVAPVDWIISYIKVTSDLAILKSVCIKSVTTDI